MAAGTDPVKPAEVLVATGNKQHRDPARRDRSQRDRDRRPFVPGEAVVGTGRISAARMVTPVLPTLPFTKSQLAKLDDALVWASRSANLYFGATSATSVRTPGVGLRCCTTRWVSGPTMQCWWPSRPGSR